MAMPAALNQAYDQQARRNRSLVIMMVCVVLLIGGAVAATRGMQALGFGAKPADTKSLSAEGQLPDTNILSAAGNPSPPVMDATAHPSATMPPDVLAWLEHLRKTEEARVALTTTQLSKAMTEYAKSQAFGGVDTLKDLLNGIDDPKQEVKAPTDELYPVLKELHDQSRELIVTFDSVPPPAECQPIHDAYYQSLSETTGMLGDIADHIKAGDIDKLLQMKGTSSSTIDSAANTSDRLVGEICDKYNTRRWFYIKGDIGSDGMLGMPKL